MARLSFLFVLLSPTTTPKGKPAGSGQPAFPISGGNYTVFLRHTQISASAAAQIAAMLSGTIGDCDG